MIFLASILDFLILAAAVGLFFWAFCALCDVVDAAIERLRGAR